MKAKRLINIKRTTLLMIGAIVLWSTVAIWNEIKREDTGEQSHRTSTIQSSTPDSEHIKRKSH